MYFVTLLRYSLPDLLSAWCDATVSVFLLQTHSIVTMDTLRGRIINKPQTRERGARHTFTEQGQGGGAEGVHTGKLQHQ